MMLVILWLVANILVTNACQGDQDMYCIHPGTYLDMYEY